MEQPLCKHVKPISKWDSFTQAEQERIVGLINTVNEIGDRPGLVGAIADAENFIGVCVLNHD